MPDRREVDRMMKRQLILKKAEIAPSRLSVMRHVEGVIAAS